MKKIILVVFLGISIGSIFNSWLQEEAFSKEDIRLSPQGKILDKDYFIAYEPQEDAVVFRIKGRFPTHSRRFEREILRLPFLRDLPIREKRIFQAGNLVYSPQFKGKLTSTLKEDIFSTEIKIPLNSKIKNILRERFKIPDGFFKAKVREERLSTDKIRIYLDYEVGGLWYKLSCKIPPGYTIKEIRRLDGKLIENKFSGSRETGLIEEETLWYTEKDTLYFYDNPIYGYDVTLNPPAPFESLIIETSHLPANPRQRAGQIGVIGYPYSGGTLPDSHDHVGMENDWDGMAVDIDPLAGSKIAIRRDGLAHNYGNPGTTWTNGTTTGGESYCFRETSRTVYPSNTTPDGTIESCIVTQMETTIGAPQFLVTQKIIIRGNNRWFAVVYYIRNNGTVSASNVHFFQGMDWNFDGSYTGDNCFYSAPNDLVYGEDPGGAVVSFGGFRSNQSSTARDVTDFWTMWGRIRNNTLANGTSHSGDAATALRWTRATLGAGETWTLPLIWGYHNSATELINMINHAINNELYDVGINSIDSPQNGERINRSQSPIALRATAALYGVVDISNLPVRLRIEGPAGFTPIDTVVQNVNLAVPTQESQQVTYSWDISNVPLGTYTITYYTNLSGDQDSANNSKQIQVIIGDFSLGPDQGRETTPGTNVDYTLTLDNGSSTAYFDFTVSASSRNLATHLYDGATLFARDNDGNGTWDWIDSSYDYNSNGRPDIRVTGGSTRNIILRKVVPSTTPWGITDTTTLTATHINDPAITDNATVITSTPPSQQAKQLYLYRVPITRLTTQPETAGDYVNVSRGSSGFWNMDPVFAKDFVIKRISGANNDIAIPLYLALSAAGSKGITVVLQSYHPLTGTQTLGSATMTVTGTTPTLYNFYIELSKDETVSAGGKLILRIDNPVSPTQDLWVYVGDTAGSNRSRIEMDTTTYITVDWIRTYLGATERNVFSPGNTVTTRARISDPFGSYDISQARITILDPSNNPVVNNEVMTLEETDPSSPSVWRRYTYNYTLPGNAPRGRYTIRVIGYESNNVTRDGTQYFLVGNPPTLDWTGETNYLTDGLNPEIGYTNTEFEYRIRYTDLDNDAPTSIQVWIDFNQDGDFVDFGEVLNMTEVNPADTDYTDGKLYRRVVSSFPAEGENYSYRFYSHDGYQEASGDPTLPINYPNIVNGLDLFPGPHNPSASNETPSAQDVEMLQFRLISDGVEDIRVTQITLIPLGTGHDVDDLPPEAVGIYRDVNRNGIYEPGIDTFIHSGNYTGDNTATVFDIPDQTISKGGSQDWLVVYDFDSTYTDVGDTFQVEIQPQGVTARGVTTGNSITVRGDNVLGGLKTIVLGGVGSLTLNPGPNNPSDSTISRNAQDLVMIQLALSASPVEDINISSITFTGSGSANEGEDITSVQLWLDGDSDGRLDPPPTDTQLGTTQTYTTDNGTVTFNLAPPETISAGATENWIVVYDLNGNASHSETFRVRLVSNAHVTASGASSGNPITPTGAPVGGGVMTVSGVPTLDWTGEPNYISDGLHPEVGYSSTIFTYRVKYTDPDNNPPSYIRVYIDRNGDGDYNDSGEVNNMNEVNPGDINYTDGKLYTYFTTISYGPNADNCSYYFRASDGTHNATGAPTSPINAPDLLPTLGISVNPTTWPIGIVDKATTRTMTATEKITVTNTGEVNVTFTLKVTNPPAWTAGTSPGVETYVMSAIFCHATDNTPTEGDFNQGGTEDCLTTSTQVATTTRFAYTGGTANGVNVAPTAQRALFLQFKAPTSTNETGEQSIVVTVGCQAP